MICMVVRSRRTRRGSWVVTGHVRLVRDLASDRRVSARPVWRSEIEIECVGAVGPAGAGRRRAAPREPRVRRTSDAGPERRESAAQRGAGGPRPAASARAAVVSVRGRVVRSTCATAGSNVAMCLVSSSSSRGDIVDRILRGRRYTPPNNSIRNAFTVAPLVRQMQASLHPHR